VWVRGGEARDLGDVEADAKGHHGFFEEALEGTVHDFEDASQGLLCGGIEANHHALTPGVIAERVADREVWKTVGNKLS